jgi:hypothetical protein
MAGQIEVVTRRFSRPLSANYADGGFFAPIGKNEHPKKEMQSL